MKSDKLHRALFEAFVPRQLEQEEAQLTPSMARLGFYPIDVEKRRTLCYKSDGLPGKVLFDKQPEGFKLKFVVPTITAREFPDDIKLDGRYPFIDGDFNSILSYLERHYATMRSAIANGAKKLSTFNFRPVITAILAQTGFQELIENIKANAGPNIDIKERTDFTELGDTAREGTYTFALKPFFKLRLTVDIEPSFINLIKLEIVWFREELGAYQKDTPYDGGFDELWRSLKKFRAELAKIQTAMGADPLGLILHSIHKNKRKPSMPRKLFS